MLKLTAIMLLGAGFVCGGRYLAASYINQTEFMRDVLLMISVIRTRLRYDCLPVSDLLRVLCGTDKLKKTDFLFRCLEGVNSGEPFPEAWRNSVESDSRLCRLLGNRKDDFIRLGAEIGATDVEGQMSCCEYYEQIFEKELTLREENEKKYKKLYPLLGLMLGISAVIIIV